MSYIFETVIFKLQQWDVSRHDFLESAPGLGLFVTVTTYDDEVNHSFMFAATIHASPIPTSPEVCAEHSVTSTTITCAEHRQVTQKAPAFHAPRQLRAEMPDTGSLKTTQTGSPVLLGRGTHRAEASLRLCRGRSPHSQPRTSARTRQTPSVLSGASSSVRQPLRLVSLGASNGEEAPRTGGKNVRLEAEPSSNAGCPLHTGS